MESNYKNKELNTAVEAVFSLCEKIKKDTPKPFDKIDEIIYNSTENYKHYYPRELILKLTSNCNLRCKHCFFYGKPESYNAGNDLPADEFYQIIKDLVDETYLMKCTITGGEIFSSPIIKNVIQFLKSKNVELSMISNATLITEKMAEWLGEQLNPKYDHIQISLDGATAETNDSIRGKGAFEKTIKAIKNLISNGVVVQIGFTVNSQNVHQIADLYKLCQELGVQRLNIGRFSLSDKAQEYLVPNPDEVFINLAKLADIYDDKTELQIRCVRTPHFLNYESGRKLLDEKLLKGAEPPLSLHCSPHHELFALFPNGDITLCYACDKEEAIIGNITKNSFDKIWKYRFSSPIFADRVIENNVCKNCKYIALCCCGCLYEAYKKHGTINAMAFDCNYFKEVVEEQNV